MEPNTTFKLSFPDYNELGDLISVSINKPNQKRTKADVTTCIDDPKVKVVFNISYSDLPDGTQYVEKTVFDVPE